MLKNDIILTFKKICSIEFFEKIELERYNLCLELYKLSNKFTEGNARYLCSSLGVFTHVTSYFFPIINLFPTKLVTSLS